MAPLIKLAHECHFVTKINGAQLIIEGTGLSTDMANIGLFHRPLTTHKWFMKYTCRWVYYDSDGAFNEMFSSLAEIDKNYPSRKKYAQ